jgi:hypothetical protein
MSNGDTPEQICLELGDIGDGASTDIAAHRADPHICK